MMTPHPLWRMSLIRGMLWKVPEAASGMSLANGHKTDLELWSYPSPWDNWGKFFLGPKEEGASLGCVTASWGTCTPRISPNPLSHTCKSPFLSLTYRWGLQAQEGPATCHKALKRGARGSKVYLNPNPIDFYFYELRGNMF